MVGRVTRTTHIFALIVISISYENDISIVDSVFVSIFPLSLIVDIRHLLQQKILGYPQGSVKSKISTTCFFCT